MAQDLPSLPPLFWVSLYENSARMKLTRQPVGFIRWGDDLVFEIRCATEEDLAEVEKKCKRPPYGDPQFYLPRDGDRKQIAHAAWLAFGRLDSPLSLGELENVPNDFFQAMREAVMVFLWVGPVSQPPGANGSSNRTKKGASSTRGSGSKGTKRATSSKPRQLRQRRRGKTSSPKTSTSAS